MLNHKCKDHRGRLPQNKTDALCIVEVGNQITRAFATVIENKKSEHIMPIICSQVASGSIVWTDEHKSYASSYKNSFIYNIVCHKYEFVNKDDGTNI
ncbi:hypothetical protein H311_01206 [Anncaliia algerae PRA109]|nr:hypothetical protein H311_01206 [Anncaliia algerae PRA109]